jgi:hypothetical protein
MPTRGGQKTGDKERAVFGRMAIMDALEIKDKNFLYILIEQGAPIYRMEGTLVCHVSNVYEFIKTWTPAESKKCSTARNK